MKGRWASVRAAWRLALREGRHAGRRVVPYMASITLGVAALVSIHSFRADVSRSLEREAEALMGADARLSGDAPPPPEVEAVLDSLRAEGVATARVTSAGSMVLAPATDVVRLVQVRALEPGYPFYGGVRTNPPGAWGRHLEAGQVLVDPAVLTQFEVAVGDTLVVGRARLQVAGTVDDLPTDLGFQTAVGPRIHLSQETMEEAGLLGFGSLARYETFLRLDERADREVLEERYDSLFRAGQLRYTTAGEQARRLSNGVRFLGRFLALVGLGALLLGGIGVASAIHVYVLEKRASIAVLRCLGARQSTTFLAYLLQAGALGALGAGAGVLLGVLVQASLPALLGDVLPVSVTTRFSPGSALAGLGIGIWVALVFALIPLLTVRDVAPLQALRADIEPPRAGGKARVAAYAALSVSVLALCLVEAPEPEVGLGFAAGLAAALALLWTAALALARGTRRFFPRGASYPVRQGVSNLFRPRNQTVAVTLALGFGAFVIGMLLEVEGTVRRDLSLSFGGGRPNLLLFDIQPDQVEGVLELLPDDAREGAEVTPLVSARIAAINGRTPDELRTGGPRDERPEGWALRREYRNTYRSELGRAEEVVAGRWWDDVPGLGGVEGRSGGLPGVSLEEDVAESLRTELGDTVTWNVSGVEIPSVVTSLRRVDWERLEPNFFAILEPGALEDAPQTFILLARLPDAEARAVVQRDLVQAYPNVSALDVSRVQEAIDSVLGSVRRAVGFLGAFAALAGALVLVGALATSRTQRVREGALLRTLGARRSQVLTVLMSEYLALGTLATASGLVLAALGAGVMLPAVFEMSYVPNVVTLGTIWVVVTGLTVVVGLVGSRSVLRRPPLPVLRAASEEA